MKRVLLTALLMFVTAGFVFAEDADISSKKELPKSGSLSFSGSAGGNGSFGVGMPWGSDEQGDSPISGSVSRAGTDAWMMRVFNNSKDTYSVSLRVVQKNERGTQVKSDSFSYVLKGGQKAERKVSSVPASKAGELMLDKWKNLTPKKKKEDKGATLTNEEAESAGEEQ